jgi:hypothetical protein
MNGVCLPWGTSLAQHRTWWRTSPFQLYLHFGVSLRSVLVILIHYLYMEFQRRLFSHSLPTIIAKHIRSFSFDEPEDAYVRLLVHPHAQRDLSFLPLSVCCLSLVDDEYNLGILVSLVFKVQWLMWRRNWSLEYCSDKLEWRQIHSLDHIETLHDALITTNTVGKNGACLCVQDRRLDVKSILLYI